MEKSMISIDVYEKGAWVLMRDSNGWIAEVLDNNRGHKIRRVRVFSPLCPEGETGTCYADEIERTITTKERDMQREEFQRFHNARQQAATQRGRHRESRHRPQPSMTPAIASAANLVWWDGRWDCEGRGIHAGDSLKIRAMLFHHYDKEGEPVDVPGEWLDVRIESTDGGQVLLAFREIQGLTFSIRVGPGHELRWPDAAGTTS